MGEIPAATLFNAGLYDPTTKTTDVERWLKEEAYAAADAHHHHHHDHDVNRHDDLIRAYCLSYDAPTDWESFVDWVEALTTVHGDPSDCSAGFSTIRGMSS